MPGVIPDEGELRALAVMLGMTPAEAFGLRLFVNDHTPGLTDTVADYDEMSGHGYAPITLDSTAWTVSPANPGVNTPAKGTTALQRFTFPTGGGAPVNVFGYYLVGLDSSRLWGAQRFADGPYVVRNDGDEIEVTPVLQLRSGYP